MRRVLEFLTKRLKLGQLREVTPTPPFDVPQNPMSMGVRTPPVGGKVSIEFPSAKDTGKFGRYVPFGDTREVIVRRGTATGFHYGFEQKLKRVRVDGGEFDMVTFESILSPPPLLPGQAVTPDLDGSYRPVYDVLYLPDTEVMIPRRPVKRGFSDEEVAKILKGIRVG